MTQNQWHCSYTADSRLMMIGGKSCHGNVHILAQQCFSCNWGNVKIQAVRRTRNCQLNYYSHTLRKETKPEVSTAGKKGVLDNQVRLSMNNSFCEFDKIILRLLFRVKSPEKRWRIIMGYLKYMWWVQCFLQILQGNAEMLLSESWIVGMC